MTIVVEGRSALSAGEQHALFRIAQEALNNVVKHSHAREAAVRVRLAPPRRLEVVDDGVGFDPAQVSASRGMGLGSMRERAHEVGWTLRAESAPGSGTRVIVEECRAEAVGSGRRGEGRAVTGEEPIKVVIVDDHQVVRQGLRTFLELQGDVSVIGEAGDGAAAVRMVEELAPDVVLMDLVMPGMDGITATGRIGELGGRTSVIVLTSFAEDDQIFPAIEAGAVSYLLKDVSPDDLVAAVRAAHRGEPRLHPDVARKLMAAARAGGQAAAEGAGVEPAPAAPAAARDDGLTERELEVVRLVAQGRSNREIAKALWISEKTVKAHVSHVLSKLGLQDRTQLAIHAIKNGLAGED